MMYETSERPEFLRLQPSHLRCAGSHLVLPGRLLHEEMEDSEAQRLRGSTGLLAVLEATNSFSSSSSRKPLDRPEKRQQCHEGKTMLSAMDEWTKINNTNIWLQP